MLSEDYYRLDQSCGHVFGKLPTMKSRWEFDVWPSDSAIINYHWQKIEDNVNLVVLIAI